MSASAADDGGEIWLSSQQKQARMWQLVRIMVRLLPASRAALPITSLNLTKQQVTEYLAATLGEPGAADSAPHPEWGVPEGWQNYLARAISWAVGKSISGEQLAKCVQQQQNRIWSVMGEPPLPLTRIDIAAHLAATKSSPCAAGPCMRRGRAMRLPCGFATGGGGGDQAPPPAVSIAAAPCSPRAERPGDQPRRLAHAAEAGYVPGGAQGGRWRQGVRSVRHGQEQATATRH